MLQVITIGFSAFLLFLIQPMIAKIILPDFGGGSYIWLTSLVFFQIVLLAGYASSHLLIKTWKASRQFLYYLAITALALIFLPVKVRLFPCLEFPSLCILLLLTVSIGLPYFILSTTTPIVQAWISTEDNPLGRNPYILFGVSNFGSLAGLLSYPFIIEAEFTNTQQIYFWSICFCIYLFLILTCSLLHFKSASKKRPHENSKIKKEASIKTEKISWTAKTSWLYKSMLPAAALMTFTHHLTLDVVNLPLLWVIPLSLYLLSFSICFFWPGISRPRPARTLLVILPLAFFTISLRGEFEIPLFWQIIASCACLFSLCIFFHGDLEREKPKTRDLTLFYLYLSIGGCLGGIFVAIVAPIVFTSNFELFIVLVVSLYIIVHPYIASMRKQLVYFVQFATAALLVFLYVNEEVLYHSFMSYRARSFYGTYVIREIPAVNGRHAAAKILSHGTTTHGGEVRDTKNRLIPISYYHTESGVGLTLLKMKSIKKIGAVGLGTGVIALYGRQGQEFDFFEIDRLIVDIAENDFENLSSSRSKIRTFVGDGRLELRKMPDRAYDLLVMDAFTSGSIPTHLVTVEAMKEFLRVLAPDGIILYHISNYYVDLLPVLNCIANELGLSIRHQFSPGDPFWYKSPAHWVLLTKNENSLVSLTAGDPSWKIPGPKKVCWTDEKSNLWSVVNFSH
jgi:SAM-dependent methyltransferase